MRHRPRFHTRAHTGGTLTVSVRVSEKRGPNTVVLLTNVMRGDELLVGGIAEVQPPTTRIEISALVVPNIESGNILARNLTFSAQAEGAGLVLGAQVPLMLTSRADDKGSRLFSCAVAVLHAHWLETGKSAVTPPPIRESAR
jgi:hypothetical protein